MGNKSSDELSSTPNDKNAQPESEKDHTPDLRSAITGRIPNPLEALSGSSRIHLQGSSPDTASHPDGTAPHLPTTSASIYRKIPSSLATVQLPTNVPRWRIEFNGLSPGVEPLGFDVLGDSLIGRGRVGVQAADIDLDLYGGLERGVSRRHALLRPSANSLYLMDLGSTNGTSCNNQRLAAGVTLALNTGDTITFGRLSMTIKIVDRPAPVNNEDTYHLDKEVDGTRPLAQTYAPEFLSDYAKEIDPDHKDAASKPVSPPLTPDNKDNPS
jgi:hypothetical protein